MCNAVQRIFYAACTVAMTLPFQQLWLAVFAVHGDQAWLVAPILESSSVPGMVLALLNHFLQVLSLGESFSFSLKETTTTTGLVFIFWKVGPRCTAAVWSCGG